MEKTEYHKSPRWKVVLYFLPLFLGLIATVFSPHKPLDGAAIDKVRALEGYRTYLYGSIYLFALILTLSRPVTAFNIVRKHIPYILFLVYVIWSATWSDYPVKVLVIWMHYIGFYLISLSAVLVTEDENDLMYPFILFGIVMVCGTLLMVNFFPDRSIVDVGRKLRWVGFTNSANSLGAVMLLTVWSGVLALFYARRWVIRAIILVFMVAAVVCLRGSDSMTSTILSVLTLLLLPVTMVIGKLSPRRSAVLIAIVGVMSFTVIVLFCLIFPDVLDKQVLLGNLSSIGRTATFTGRTVVWDKALMAIKERPLMGWSFDSLYSVEDRFLIHAAHFHNGYLDLLVSGGICALLLMFGIIIHFVYKLMLLQRGNSKLWSGLVVLLFVILLHNGAESSLGRVPTLFWLVFTFVYMVIHCPVRGKIVD